MKRLICCLDGTWNDDKEGTVLTNVAKLHRSILPRDQKNIEQLAHYVTGIATAYEGRTQFVLGAIGFEVEDRVKAAYTFFVDNYDPGDEIALFGFSRGAFEARSLGGFIALVGIAKRGAGFSLDEAWALYRRPPGRRDEGRLAALRAAAHFLVRIKCIGVWDTVGNLGNPFFQGPWAGRRHGFHDLSLNDSIDVALQALSIDEVRGPFRPTLWSLKEDTSLPAHQHVEQVWFAGTHADVGGGWPETALSDIALLWMAERANEIAGLGFNTDWLRQTTAPNPLGVQHSVTSEGIYRLSALCPFIRLIGQCLDGIPRLRRLFLGSWRTSRLPHGQVSVNERVHQSALSRLGETVPELCGTTRRDIVYQPQNLVGFVEASRRAG